MIIFDLETTDLVKPSAAKLDQQPHIIEFAAIKLDTEFSEKERLAFLVKPPIPIPEEITKITGINDAMVADQRTFASRYHDLCQFFRDESILIAHNVAFDTTVLCYELQRIGKDHAFPWPWVQKCTVEASYCINNRRMNLGDLYQLLFGKRFSGAHRAMNDVEALTEITVELFKREML